MIFCFQDIQRHVLGRLRSLLFGNEADAESTGEVLEYFMRRLSSVQTAERDSAVKVTFVWVYYTVLLMHTGAMWPVIFS